ncbi:MAG: Flp family type IVb pilin [Gemmatimonadaceae bacterium]
MSGGHDCLAHPDVGGEVAVALGELHRPPDCGQRRDADEEGAALAEYGILVAFIAIVAITAVTFFGSRITAKFSQYANSLS